MNLPDVNTKSPSPSLSYYILSFTIPFSPSLSLSFSFSLPVFPLFLSFFPTQFLYLSLSFFLLQALSLFLSFTLSLFSFSLFFSFALSFFLFLSLFLLISLFLSFIISFFYYLSLFLSFALSWCSSNDHWFTFRHPWNNGERERMVPWNIFGSSRSDGAAIGKKWRSLRSHFEEGIIFGEKKSRFKSVARVRLVFHLTWYLGK